LQAFCIALAEGRRVEEQRVAALIELWDLPPNASPEARKSVGVHIDHQVKSFLHEKLVSSSHDLSGRDQQELSGLVAKTLANALGCPAVSVRLVGETVAGAVSALAVREAWIYRDWQAAIGDLMLRRVEQGQRQFEVMGYLDFEALCATGEEAERLWLRRLYAVIDDLDVFGSQAADARIDQLRAAHHATAKIIDALHHADLDRSRISDETLTAAAALLGRSAGG
jgi:hypothetical protein